MTLIDENVLEHDIYIAARPEIVFSFFIDPVKMTHWMGLQATLDPRPGGLYRLDVNGRDIARGQYLEVTPYERIVFTWGWEGDGSPLPPGASTVEISLTPNHGGTRVYLRHLDLPDIPMRQRHAQGWEHYLTRLSIAAEGRTPGPDPLATPSYPHI